MCPAELAPSVWPLLCGRQDKLVPGARALDVGSGSGYLTACMGLMVSPGGSVLGVEKEEQLAALGAANVASAAPQLTQSGAVCIVHGNVLSGKAAAWAPNWPG